MRSGVLWLLVLVFAPLSLLSIGGGQSIIADMDKQVVHVQGWLTQPEFLDLFAISRAAPGPGSLLVTLIGWKVAGIPGALVASLALFLPSSLVAYGVARLWNRHRGRRWHSALEQGLPPIASGLVLSGAFTVLQASPEGGAAWIIAALATAMLLLLPKCNPLLVLALGGIGGVLVGQLV
jgi:chromate transporter